MSKQINEDNAIVAQVRPIASLIDHLSIEGRITLLSALLSQEICNLPQSERRDRLDRVLCQMPEILRLTENGMREALVNNAREGL